MKNQWLFLEHTDILTESKQASEEGRDLTKLEAEFEFLLQANLDDPLLQARAEALLDSVQRTPTRDDYHYDEPSDLEGIKAARAGADTPLGPLPEGAALRSKVAGAWYGRACGCLLGKPVEGWHTDTMIPMLKDSGNFPIHDYVRWGKLSEHWRSKFSEWSRFGDLVKAMPEDDDMNYSVTGLALFKRYGRNFRPVDVANFWMSEIPLLHTCTAERIAYRNFAMSMSPPASATYRNPYREWIGAQIRADFFGYVAPGQPALAAEFAWRDASISHVRNGIYGEMWVAAMLAAAYVLDDLEAVILAGLDQVPTHSRLHEQVTRVLQWFRDGVSYDEAVARIHAEWDEHTWHGFTHTISNAMLVAIGLLWSEGRYSTAICRAVQPAFDTDCNGATVGSIFGLVHGFESIEPRWLEPLHGLLETGVAGYNRVPFDQLVDETLALIVMP